MGHDSASLNRLKLLQVEQYQISLYFNHAARPLPCQAQTEAGEHAARRISLSRARISYMRLSKFPWLAWRPARTRLLGRLGFSLDSRMRVKSL
jgi:hypothetical protein